MAIEEHTIRRRRQVVVNAQGQPMEIEEKSSVPSTRKFTEKLSKLEDAMLAISVDNIGLAKREYNLKQNIIGALESKFGDDVPIEERNSNIFTLAESNAFSRLFKSLDMLSRDITSTVGIPTELIGRSKLPKMTFTEIMEMKKKIQKEMKALGLDPNVIEAEFSEEEND